MTSIADLKKRINEDRIRLHVQANTITDYDSFIDWTHKTLIYSIQKVEAKRDLLCTACENTITAFIQTSIEGRSEINSVRSNTEGHASGHCDLNIFWGEFSWQGEAKIYGGPAYLLEGYDQLTERYFAGTSAYNYAGMLIYFQEPMAKKIEGYKTQLRQTKTDLTIDDSPFPEHPLYFNANGLHPHTNLPINVIHFPINLDHQSRENKEKKTAEKLREEANNLLVKAKELEEKLKSS